ncbi:MAG: 2-oxo acid dehydrogenase subunit E2 [Ruminococcaceae bacterium]|nr:2-oxo acid dehydrogenase subunit E2 [Oscillospiraceae bacterium]
MFGRRPDGRSVGSAIDPITRLTPYIMTKRSDAQVMSTQFIDGDILRKYIREKRNEGFSVTHMSVIIAAFVRTISQMPHINRFVVGKKLYARNELAVSFAILKQRGKKGVAETTVKIKFDPSDTIYDVAKRVQKVIDDNKEVEDKNNLDKFVNFLLAIPGFAAVVVGLAKLMDRLGLVPKKILDLSPFHTSMFITNMASINMEYVHHHIYNFGTTSYFLGVGKSTYRPHMTRDGTLKAKRVYPVGIVVDERVSVGGEMGLALNLFRSYLKNPWDLETPPEKVYFDVHGGYSLKKVDEA